MVKKLKKTYETPNEGWSEERIQREEELKEEYGLNNKKEIYKAQSQLRSFRRKARELVSEEDDSEAVNDIKQRAHDIGLVKGNAELEDLFTLNVTDFLDRRLQTAVNRRGYSDTVNEARQLVVHGHVYVDGQRVNVPGYLLTKQEEKNLEVRRPEPEEEVEEENDTTEEESQDSEESEEEGGEE
ncbi:MAG: 30S ribosomal protein S4 [Nanohaloarchaea archaeon SW_7_46_7]|nr:MAG: 30S ribosomal protein S4 [Nanohaloarchaea archaeon SW_7_46_7]